MINQTLARRCVDQAQQDLARIGIKDHITVKVKPYKERWMARYRAGSKIRGGIPIIWIPPDLDKRFKADTGQKADSRLLCRMIRDSAIHEYGHVIVEWARFLAQASNDPELLRRIGQPDEEVFAEDFVDFVNELRFINYYEPIVEYYVANQYV